MKLISQDILEMSVVSLDPHIWRRDGGKEITLIRRAEWARWAKICHQTKARDGEKGTVSLCNLKSVLLEAAFCQERWLSRELSSSHYDVFIYLFTVQVPKLISKLIMKFEIPHWDMKNCWGNSTFLSVTTHAVLVHAQTYCSDQAVIAIAQRTELSVWLPLPEIRCQNPSYNHTISDRANQDEFPT